MKKNKIILFILPIILFSCSQPNNDSMEMGKFDKSGTSNYEVIKKAKEEKTLSELLEKTELGDIDLAAADLSEYDLTDYLDELKIASFSSTTKWGKLPAEFDPNKILENAKKQGLGIEELNANGVNGENIGIAIIDAQLLLDHIEYKNQLQMYYSSYSLSRNPRASYHGSAMTSILSGKEVGIAPKASIYYIADKYCDEDSTIEELISVRIDYIEKVIQLNSTLPENQKIRVITTAHYYDESADNYEDMIKVREKAKKEGIFVCDGNVYVKYFGNPLRLKQNADSNQLNSYELENDFYEKGLISLPIGGRTISSANGEKDYEYEYASGISEGITYVAGLYALCCQVDPEMNFYSFIQAVQDTCSSYSYNEFKDIKVVNPIELINFFNYE